MSLSLKEAETAAYLDPSQENLAVYVKLLALQLEALRAEAQYVVDRLERLLEESPSPEDLADAEADRDALALQLEALRAEAQYVVDHWETEDHATLIRDLAALL